MITKGDGWLRLTALPAKHGPGLVNALLPPVMGNLLEWGVADSPARLRLYISEDTLLQDDLKEIPQRYSDIDLALLHLGGTQALGILLTMDAQQGVQTLRLVQPKTAIPIHYNDYTVFKSGLEDFMRAVAAAGLQTHVHELHHGDTYSFQVPMLSERGIGG
jgi:L-ascorbate metabolism protein UlaG (beta-lactamase superfamily)